MGNLMTRFALTWSALFSSAMKTSTQRASKHLRESW